MKTEHLEALLLTRLLSPQGDWMEIANATGTVLVS